MGLFPLQISIEGVRGPSFEGDIAVDSISFIAGRCMTRVSDEEIQADSHLGLGEDSTTAPRICSVGIKRLSQTSVLFCLIGKRFVILFQLFEIGGTSVQSKLPKNKMNKLHVERLRFMVCVLIEVLIFVKHLSLSIRRSDKDLIVH